MIASRTLLVAAVIAALCVACGHDKRAMKTVTSRASFDLSCPQAELELTILATSGARRLASQIGVTGCGNKVVYVYFASTDSWIADSAILQGATSPRGPSGRSGAALRATAELPARRQSIAPRTIAYIQPSTPPKTTKQIASNVRIAPTTAACRLMHFMSCTQ